MDLRVFGSQVLALDDKGLRTLAVAPFVTRQHTAHQCGPLSPFLSLLLLRHAIFLLLPLKLACSFLSFALVFRLHLQSSLGYVAAIAMSQSTEIPHHHGLLCSGTTSVS